MTRVQGEGAESSCSLLLSGLELRRWSGAEQLNNGSIVRLGWEHAGCRYWRRPLLHAVQPAGISFTTKSWRSLLPSVSADHNCLRASFPPSVAGLIRCSSTQQFPAVHENYRPTLQPPRPQLPPHAQEETEAENGVVSVSACLSCLFQTDEAERLTLFLEWMNLWNYVNKLQKWEKVEAQQLNRIIADVTFQTWVTFHLIYQIFTFPFVS